MDTVKMLLNFPRDLIFRLDNIIRKASETNKPPTFEQWSLSKEGRDYWHSLHYRGKYHLLPKEFEVRQKMQAEYRRLHPITAGRPKLVEPREEYIIRILEEHLSPQSVDEKKADAK